MQAFALVGVAAAAAGKALPKTTICAQDNEGVRLSVDYCRRNMLHARNHQRRFRITESIADRAQRHG